MCMCAHGYSHSLRLPCFRLVTGDIREIYPELCSSLYIEWCNDHVIDTSFKPGHVTTPSPTRSYATTSSTSAMIRLGPSAKNSQSCTYSEPFKAIE